MKDEFSHELLNQLSEQFPINYEETRFTFYPFSNESGFSRVLSKLNREAESDEILDKEKNAALLLGESHFLSMLPELQKHISYVILADIEPKIFWHRKHLLECITKANNISEFIEFYSNNNPIADSKIENNAKNILNSLNVSSLTKILTGEIGASISSLGKYHFLSTEDRFIVCKEAASRLLFSQIQFDLADKAQCQKLSEILNHYNINLKLCNFTNIHEYGNNLEKIKTSVPVLLSKASNYRIMYATEIYNTNSSKKIDYYFNLFRKLKVEYLPPDIDDEEDLPIIPELLHSEVKVKAEGPKKASIYQTARIVHSMVDEENDSNHSPSGNQSSITKITF